MKQRAIEQRVLATCLARDRSLTDLVFTSVQPEDFTEPIHRTLYGLILDAIVDGDTPTVFNIGERARKTGNALALEALHGLSIPDYSHLAPASVKQDCIQLQDSGKRSRLVSLGNYISASAGQQNGKTTDDLTNELYNHMLAMITGGQSRGMMNLQTAIERTEKRQEEYRALDYGKKMKTGFPKLDRVFMMSPGEMTILGGYTSHGKSSFALCIANYLASEGVGVMYVSIEMDFAKIVYRLAAMNGDTEMGQFVRGNVFNLNNAPGIRAMAPYMENFHICDLDSATETEIVLMMQRHMFRHSETGLVVIDYLQNVDCDRYPRSSRHLQISSIARYFRSAAKRFKTHVILISQLARPEKRDGKNRLANKYDLKESGDIETSADSIILVNRLTAAQDWPALIDLAKQRDGQLARVAMQFTGRHVRFDEVEREDMSEEILKQYKIERASLE